MIVIDRANEERQSGWQHSFLEALPEIERRLHLAFCRLDPDAREESIAEGVLHSLQAYIRLNEQGRTEVATPSTLAWYSARQVKHGRPAAGRMNCNEPLSRYGKTRRGIRIQPLQSQWIEMLVEDKRAAVADRVAAKIDVSAWFATLTQRMRQIAKELAFGYSTSEVARKHGVTAGRISQLRRSLEQSWLAFEQSATRELA
jgi:hypothetical protein